MKPTSRRSTPRSTTRPSPKPPTHEEIAAAIARIANEGTSEDDWPDAITVAEYTKQRGYSTAHAAKECLERMVRDGKLEKKVVRRRINRSIRAVTVYRVKT